MKNTINAYVPEIDFTKEKQTAPSRAHREDVAVIAPSEGYHVLACRMQEPANGDTLSALWKIEPAEMNFLETALSSSKRVILRTQDRAVLILGDPLSASGTLLAIRPQVRAEQVCRFFGQREALGFAISPTLTPSTSLPTEQEEEQLLELTFCLTRILDPAETASCSVIGQRIAHFVGCDTTGFPLPSDEPTVAESDRKRLTAFLLCVFLALRSQNGSLTLGNGASDTTAIRCRVEYAADDGESVSELPDDPCLAFRNFRAFQNFTVRVNQNRLILDLRLSLQEKEKTLHSLSPTQRVRITLENNPPTAQEVGS